MVLLAGEMIADQAQAALGLEALAVEGDDAGGFLAAVLQGVQAKGGEGCGVGVAVDAEDAAFFAKPVAIEIEIVVAVHWSPLWPKAGFCVSPVPWMRLSRPWVSLFW